MNILFIFHVPILPSIGGVQRVTYVLTHEFQKMGHSVFFLCYTQKELIEKNEFIAPQYYLNVYEKNADITYVELLEKLRVNVVIGQAATTEILHLLRISPASIKTICSHHIMPFASYKRERRIICNYYPHSLRGYIFKIISILLPVIPRVIYTRRERDILYKTLYSCDYLCVLSQRFIPRINKFCPNIDNAKILAINNPNTFILQSNKEFQKENLVLFVGRIENVQKNVKDFIRMWSLFSQTNPDWQAMVVGSGSDLERNKKYANKLKVKRLSFEGLQDNIAQYYKKARILAVTSFGEGWGMVITEAMAYGCVPCVYDTYESLHDIIKDGRNGYILPPYKPKIMAQVMQQIANDDKKLKELSKFAMDDISQFNAENTAQSWIKAINGY